MIWIPALLFLLGLVLSALFSGSETGLYRVPRIRLVLDALGGGRAARMLVWLVNHPAIFIATLLVGNNIANYLTSFSVVWAVSLSPGSNAAAELGATLLMTPVVFVFGELLPKSWFFQAPYRLLRRLRPFLLLTTIALAPLTFLLGLLGIGLRLITGQTPFQIRLGMARREIDQVLRAGHEAGILEAEQRSLAQRLYEIGNTPAVTFGDPRDRCVVLEQPVDPDLGRHQARRRNQPFLLIRRGAKIIGYLRYTDLCVRQPRLEPAPVVRARLTDRHLTVLLRLYDAGSDVAILTDDRNALRGTVTRWQLLRPLLR